MAIYGPDSVNITEAKRVKGQEYNRLSGYVDREGNKQVIQNPVDGQRYASNSTGRGGALDSVAQNHIKDLDVEKEKAILESDDIVKEYSLYINGQIDKALSQYDDQSKSQLEKRMVEEYNFLKNVLQLDTNKLNSLVAEEYYGGKYIPDDATEEEKARIIRTVLRLRLNYVDKITSLLTKMLKTNYKVLGLSEEQAKTYINSLSSGDNSSTKAAGEVLQIIKDNGDKFVTNNGQSVDLTSLGFGVILGPTTGYELGFLGTDMTNKDAMLNLIQTAMRYDVVVVAHGSADGESDNNKSNAILNDLKKADLAIHKNKEELLNKLGSISKQQREDIYQVVNLSKQFYNVNTIVGEFNLANRDYLQKEITKLFAFRNVRSKIGTLEKDFKSSILAAANKFYDPSNFENNLRHSFPMDEEKSAKLLQTYKSRKNTIDLLVKYYYAELLVVVYKSTIIESLKGEMKTFWGCQPTKTLKSGPFDNVNDLVRQLIKEGYKKIFIKDCNPGGHKLADDIMNTKGVIINYSDFSNYIESSIIDDNDEDLRTIREAEESLMEFAESYGIDYNDDEYLEECCQWYLENYEMIHEGEVFDKIKEYFKRIVSAIIGFIKDIFRLVKKALIKLKNLFLGTKEEPKDSKTPFEKPIKTKLLDIDTLKVVEISSENRDELNKEASTMCSKIANQVKKINQKQQNALKKFENDINQLSREESMSHESVLFDDSYFFLEDSDLLSSIELLREFEDANGPVEDDEEDSDFSMDDAGEGEATPAAEETPEEPAATEDTDAPEDEEFSMDDEGEEGTEGEETQEEETPDDDEPEDEDYEIPDEEGEETGEEAPADDTDAPEDEEFSMDDTGDGTEGGEESSGDDTDTSMGEDTPSDDNIDPRLKDLESVIFDDLNEEEKKLKIKDLKELYITVYKKCGSITELLSDIKRDEETIQIVEYISNTLIDLKQYVNDYLNDIFDTKTYVENLAQLQKYIMIFNAINKVFEQIKQENNQ